MTEDTSVVQVDIFFPETPFGGVIIQPPAGSRQAELPSGNAVTSVFGRAGAVVAQAEDYAAFYMPLGTTTGPLAGPFFYWPQIKNLTGGNASTDLDAQAIDTLPDDALIAVVIPDRGGSQWLRVHDTLSTGSPSTPDDGTIVPTTYDAVLKPWILQRQLGF